jgi:hypothetical protein
VKVRSPLALIIALLLVAFTPAMAQYVPGGSYQQSCRHVHIRGGMLRAQCTAPNGRYVHSTLALPCRGDIANINGYLRCTGGGYYPPRPGGNPGYGYVPRGSYQASCRNVYANGGVLSAECTATNGAWVRSSLATQQCRPGSDIANVNGRLSCVAYR